MTSVRQERRPSVGGLPVAESSSVVAVATPPESETLKIVSERNGAKRITPSGDQLPPLPPGASAMVCAGPPPASIFLSLPPAKNATKRLSGDQNGNAASSVPARG